MSIDDLELVLAEDARLVGGVRPEQWEAPTPCTEWNVRRLVDHLVSGQITFAGVLGGAPLPPREELIRRAAEDHLGPDPEAAFRRSASALLVAFRAPGALERMITVPAGTVPGAAALQLRIVEGLVHGWDLATATAQEARFPAEAAERALAFTRARLADLGSGRAFGPSQPAPADAPALHRLVAVLGRSAG